MNFDNTPRNIKLNSEGEKGKVMVEDKKKEKEKDRALAVM